MRNTPALFLFACFVASCSGSGGDKAAGGGQQNNDSAALAFLASDHPLGDGATKAAPPERAERLAKCSAVLSSAASRNPPPARAENMRRTSDRLQQLAVTLGQANGRSADQIARVREEASQANSRLAQANPAALSSALTRAADRCGMVEVMSDDEVMRGSAF